MSYPSAPPQFGGQAPPGTYPAPTYPQQPSTGPPPPYQVYPTGPAAALPSKEPFGSVAPTQPPYQHPGSAYPPPQPGYLSGYQPPPQPGYQPPPQPGYGYQPPQPGYQPPQPGYQPPQPGYQPPQPGYQPPQPGYGYQPPPQPPVSQPQGYGAQQISAQMTGMSLQQQPKESCGVMSGFAEGNVIILKSCASGKTLRILADGTVNGQGGHGQVAQFKVHVRRPGVVSLQNVQSPDYWLAIFQGNTIGTGTGDPYCDLIVNDVDGKFACLESVMTPGQYVGVLPSGQVKPATQTKTGQHGRFIVKVQKDAASSGMETIFADGNVVILRSCASNKHLVINTAGGVQGNGGRGVTTQFKVHVRRPGVVALQSVHKPVYWLAIHQGNTIGTGKGGLYCDFELKEVEGQCVCLESVMHPGEHVGILPNGSVKPPTQTGKGQHGRFTPSVHLASRKQQKPKQPDNGASIMSMFSQGNMVILQSKASKKSLRINNGDVEGNGGRGELAQFRVHVKRPGVVALQNVHESYNWLAIFQEQTIGTGKGGAFCEFNLTVVDGSFVCLESVACPGQYVGIKPDGSVKLPNQTKTGPHGRFIPSLHI